MHKDPEQINAMALAAATAQKQLRNSLVKLSFGANGKDDVNHSEDFSEASMATPTPRLHRSTLATLAATDLNHLEDDEHDDEVAALTTGTGEHG